MISLRSELRRKLLTFFYMNLQHAFPSGNWRALDIDSTNLFANGGRFSATHRSRYQEAHTLKVGMTRSDFLEKDQIFRKVQRFLAGGSSGSSAHMAVLMLLCFGHLQLIFQGRKALQHLMHAQSHVTDGFNLGTNGSGKGSRLEQHEL
jgi:hypothetical protein